MLLKLPKSELAIGKSIYGMCWYPKCMKRLTRYGYDLVFRWLGGTIVWSRFNKTHKDIRRVQKDRPLDSGSNDLRFPTHSTRSFRDGQDNASDGHWRTHGHN